MKVLKITTCLFFVLILILCLSTNIFAADSQSHNKDFFFNMKLSFANSIASGYEAVSDTYHDLIARLGFNVTCSNCGKNTHLSPDCSEEAIFNAFVGKWSIPEVGVDVNCYNSKAQFVCDNKNSACFFLLDNQYVIADHWYQGFNAIKLCKKGMTAYFETDSGTREYICTDVLKGYNKLFKLTDKEGNTISNPDGITLYTCNSNWENITLVLFRPV